MYLNSHVLPLSTAIELSCARSEKLAAGRAVDVPVDMRTGQWGRRAIGSWPFHKTLQPSSLTKSPSSAMPPHGLGRKPQAVLSVGVDGGGRGGEEGLTKHMLHCGRNR
jgi:hypothetical protein